MQVSGITNNSYLNFNGHKYTTDHQPVSNKKKSLVGMCCVCGTACCFRKTIKDYFEQFIYNLKKLPKK